MKNAKKILLLVLSLVMLVGVFAVASLAEEEASAATVVYPDGKTVSVAVGDAIVPEAFADGLYYGQGNTLFKDDATEGWLFTVEGEDAALEDLTVTAEMAGKKILASGVQQVYSTIEVTFPEGDYYKWLSGSSGFKVDGVQYYTTVFAKAGTSGVATQYVQNSDGTLGTKEIEYNLSKRVAGTYKIYFYDVDSLETYFSTSASIELGGVLLNYQDLRHGSSTVHKVKLYADHTVDKNMFTWAQNGYDRPNTSDKTNKNATSSGGAATVKFDLNGHSFINTVASSKAGADDGYINPRAASLWIYSSVPGAHFFKENSTYAFSVNDDAVLYLGASDTNGTYADNIHFHVKGLCRLVNSGSGVRIYGGHYYQSETTTSFLMLVSGRIAAVENASFYVKNGIAVFGDNGTLQTNNDNKISNPANSTWAASAIRNCKFYTDGTSPILRVTKTSGATASLKFEGCEFYGVSTKNEDTNTNEAMRGTITLVADTANVVSESPIVYKKATYIGGAEAYYYVAAGTDAESIAKAEVFVKAFVENHPYAEVVVPYDHYVGDAYYHIEESAPVFEYDAAFNAVQKETAEGVRVYFTYTENNELIYVTDEATCGAKLQALLAALPKKSGSEIKLYSDITIAGTGVNGLGSYYYYLDVNGYKLTVTSTSNAGFAALDVCAPYFFLYSSREGGEIDVSGASSFVHTNNTTYNGVAIYGRAYIGERTEGGTDYIGNLTVYCKTITNEMHGTSISYYSTTFVQTENSASTHFFRVSRTQGGGSHVKAVKNCTFVVTKAATAFLFYANTNTAAANRTFDNCSFVCTDDGVAPLFASAITDLKSNPIFFECNFYNALPAKNLLGKAIDYEGCSFGFSGIAPSEDVDLAEETALYLVRGAAEKTIVANGVAYTLNAALSDNRGTLVTFRDEQGVIAMENWKTGATVSLPADLVKLDLENECMWKDPSCVLDGTTAIVTWITKDDFAFSYTLETITTYVYMSECGTTAQDVGDKFYALFSNPDGAFTIKLYTDMYLTKAMGFGPLVAYQDSQHNRDYYNSMVKGNITLDLNGMTVTIDKDLVGINLSTANFALATPEVQNSYKPAVFALEGQSGKDFTLISSKPGAQIINLSSASLFGVGEGDSSRVKILDENNYITVRTAGQLFSNIETSASVAMTIKGGTYIYEGATYLATPSCGTVLEDATFICTRAVTAVFRADGYRTNTFTATNCTFYAPSATKLFVKGSGNSSAFNSSSFAFANCAFLNVTLTESMAISNGTPIKVQYASAKVSSDADLALAYQGADLTGLVKAYSYKTVNGDSVKLVGYYADGAALVDWGFGITEYWLIGETATHEDAEIDGYFAYSFADVAVAEGENQAEATLIAYRPGTLQMSLTLQSKIGLNVFVTEALASATVKVGGTLYTLENAADGYFKLTKAIAPNVADDAVLVEITIGENTHVVSVGVGAYAEAILASAEYADAHALTYAMVEYVRVMAKNADFLANVAAPAGYETKILTAAPSGNEKGLLESIAFQLDGTIAIALQGTAEANGMEVALKLATGRVETATVEGTKAIFDGLYVNEFYGDMTITIGDETYTYSLANYLNGLTNADAQAGVQALYNYAAYAEEYVTALQNAQ